MRRLNAVEQNTAGKLPSFACVCVCVPSFPKALRWGVNSPRDMDEEERKARDQQLRSSIHTKLIESGEYERCAHPPAKSLCVLSAVNGE